jgi:glycosidase
MAANLLLLCPGSPFIYYGEEIGMRGSRGGANTDANRRLRMVWGDEDPVKDPQGATYDPDNRADSPVTAQVAKESSLYNYYKKVILLRKANPEIARGTYTAVSVPDSKVGGFVSTWEGSAVCVLHNPSQGAKTIDLASLGLEFDTIAACIGAGEATLEGSSLRLEGQTSVVLR